MKSYSVLLVDDEPDMLRACRKILDATYHVYVAADGADALKVMHSEHIDVAVFDLHLPGMDGLELMREALRLNPDVAVLIITGQATVDTAIQAVRDGAIDFIPKPFSATQLEVAVERSIAHCQLVDQNRQLKRDLRRVYQFEKVVAHSPQMVEVLDLVRKVASTGANVMLRGESGTGKEQIARCVHEASARERGPFVPIDCASLPESLLESELFGYEKGAFTGAHTGRAGLLESADGGTVFLDEIGNISPGLQAKLLRILEERHYRRVGGTALHNADLRFLSATNQALEEMVRRGTFREDLLYRLNVVSIWLPPLRERPADIAPLAHFFLKQCPDSGVRNIGGISSAALLALQSYHWPGNVRELKNVIWRAVSLTESNQITPLDLPPELLNSTGVSMRPLGCFRRAKREMVNHFEEVYLRRLMADAGGNVSQAARQAGMKRAALHRLLSKHKIDSDQFRTKPG